MAVNHIKPMLAVTGDPFSDPGWIFEPKIDGTRCIAHVGEGVVMLNRRHTNITHRYPELANALAVKAKDCILDGEIAVFSDGLPDFAALAAREHQNDKLRIKYLSKAMPASYIVFDILESEGQIVMDRPLSERKAILERALQEDNLVIISDFFPVKGEEYFQAALKMGIEGIMAKRLDSSYQPGVRSRDWIKIKKQLKFDLVVGGYIPGKGHREPFFGSLLLGAYDLDKLIYVGRVGSGFSFQELEDFAGDFEPVSSSPFFDPPAHPGALWLKPRQVVEVAAMEVTADFSLRAPVFLRRRFDKDPKECSIDQIRK